ncbi:MAG: response regulator transcription factor [Bacteroidota bacterium]|nr:response regulator transcription factor [Bacteroidota bacterium]
MKLLIIEDEAPAFRRLQNLLQEIDPALEIIEVIDSVEDSVKWLKNHNHPDLIFMDIQLSDGLSFEIFETIKIIKPVIFTTAFDEYTLRAFKVNSIDYLLKPIKKQDLEGSLNKYKALQSNFINNQPSLNELISHIKLDEKTYKNRFLVKVGEKLLSISTANIALLYVHNGLVYLKTKQDKNYIVDFTLDELTLLLDAGVFFRANRQFIVAFEAIKAVHKWHKGKLLVDTDPQPDEKIIVSAEKATVFKNWMGG